MEAFRSPGFRSLRRLYESGSTSRVFNLLHICRAAMQDGVRLDPPMFENAKLNAILVVKHHVRRDEPFAPKSARSVVTKLIAPVDPGNLAIGGHFTFIGEPGWLNHLEPAIGSLSRHPNDVEMLLRLDRAPSFDPFLLREWIARDGIQPSNGFFAINTNEVAQMEQFVIGEISALVGLCFGGQIDGGAARQLVRKMLDRSCGDLLKPLRDTLNLSAADFGEGVFCWRGFLFYKWNLSRISDGLPTMLHELKDRVRSCATGPDARRGMETARIRITRRVADICHTAEDILKEYDVAYFNLINRRDTAGFRRFLLSAPARFIDLGGAVGQINHLLQYWTYWTVRPGPGEASAAVELRDLLRDFEDGLGATADSVDRPLHVAI